MPEIYEPSPNGARRSALGTTTLTANRRRRRKFPIAAASKCLSSMDDLEFTLENRAHPHSHSKIASTRKMPAIAMTPKRTTSRIRPPFATLSPIPLPSIPSQSALLQQSRPPTTSTRTTALSHVRRALLVDTRALDTTQGRAIGNSFASQTRSFLASLRRRGMVPHLLISLETSSVNSDRSRPPMTPKTLRLFEDSEMSTDVMCEPLFVKLAVNSNRQTSCAQAIKMPTRFLANASWNVFGDLVEEAIRQDQKSPQLACKVPLSITLLTNNVALLCDDDMDGAHKAAMASFWNRIRPFFHKRIIRSIELEVVHAGSVVFTQNGDIGVDCSHKNDSPSINSPSPSNAENDSGIDTCTRRERVPSPMDDDVMTDFNGKESDAEKDSIHGARCVEHIQHYIAELADVDFKANRAREVTAMPVTVSVAFMENTNRGFGVLARRWLSKIMSPPNLNGSFVIELPETIDGTQCSIALDAKYRALPYAADSSAAAGLLADLQWMSSCTMDAVQLVPISCVDANLLYGVSMVVTPAFQNDVTQYKEMKALAHGLFHQLREKDVALLLQAKGPDECIASHFGPPLHHASHQTFLLMTQDVSTCVPGFEASLFRYVNADQLLSVGSIEPCTPSDDDLMEPITAYIESALEMLPNNLINPLVNDEVRILREIESMAISDSIAKTSSTEAMEIDKEEAWTDISGVGSLVQPEAVSPVEASTAECDASALCGAPAMISTLKEVAVVGGVIDLPNTSSDALDKVMSPPGVNRSLHSKTKKKIDRSLSNQNPAKSVKRHRLKTKPALPSRSPPKKRPQFPLVSIKRSPDSMDDVSEVAQTTVTSLMNRRTLSGPLTSGTKTKASASGYDNAASQESNDEICEFPATPKEKNTLDKLTATQELALGQLLSEDDSDDDHWKGNAGAGECNKSLVDPPDSVGLKLSTTDSSSDDEISAHLARRQSFQRAASVFMDTLTDTDSDPEFS